MRNLLGRLHTRSPEELARIATFWQVPLRSDDRATQVGRLYRELTDPRSVRAAWDRLSADERRCVRLLALGDEEALPLAELATQLGLSEATARQIAIRLYHVGILTRQGDDQPLPVGEAPRLFLPRELALLFRRIQDEIEAGDLSTTPLRALLELLDDAEIEEAARIWGLTVIPGLRQRSDLTGQILRQVASPGSLPIVINRLRGDATRIWQCLQDQPDGAPMPLADAADAVGLAADDARTAQRLRDALAELESSLLVWPTYHGDGSRWLFVPSEIRAPHGSEPTTPAMPRPVPAPPADAGSWRHHAAIAWDLLTVVRALTRADAPPGRIIHSLPRAWLRRFNQCLWFRGPDLPPPGYVDLLVTLAEGLGLIQRPAEAETEPPRLSGQMRGWRSRSFREQQELMRQHWRQTLDWTENRATTEIEIWGADWRGFRQRLVGLVAELPEGEWFPLSDLAGWLGMRAPDLLGDTFTAATAQPVVPEHAASESHRRHAALTKMIEITLTTSLVWMGFVETRGKETGSRVVRRVPPPDTITQESSEPALVMLPTMTIELRIPTPLRVWSLSAFSQLVRLDQISRYELTQESVQRALHAGFDLTQITTFLERQSGAPLPPKVGAQLETWTNGIQRVRLRPALIARSDDAVTAERLRDVIIAAGGTVHSLASGDLVAELPESAGSSANSQDDLAALLRAHGFATQWGSAANEARPRDGHRRPPSSDGGVDPKADRSP